MFDSKLLETKRLCTLLALLIVIIGLLPSQLAYGGSTVIINNRTVVPLRIADSHDRTLTNLVPAQSEEVALSPGKQLLRAIRLDGILYSEATLVLAVNKTIVWDILPIESVLDVRNNTTRDVTVEVDGEALVDVKAGASLRVDGIKPGSRHLTARSNGTMVAGVVAEFDKQSTYVWMLGQAGNMEAGVSVLRIRNWSGQKVDIHVNGVRRIDVSPADSAAITGLKPGRINIEARSLINGALVSSHGIDVKLGEINVWEVVGPDGKCAAVDVKNATNKVIKVCVDGSFCLRVPPGKSTLYGSLTPGWHTFQASDLSSSRLIDALEANLGTETPYEWVVGAAAQ